MIAYGLLLLAIVLNVAFAQIFRFAQLRGRNAIVVAAVNYVVAALVTIAIFLPEVDLSRSVDSNVIIYGCVNGLLYITHLIVILAAFELAGVGITSAMVGAAVVMPVFVSWALWPESDPMHVGRWLSLVLIPGAIYLMRPPKAPTRKLTLKADVALFFSFAIAGVIGTVHKLASRAPTESDEALYRITLFCVAAVASLAYVMARGYRPARRDIAPGIAAGSTNVALLWVFIVALDRIEAGILFPTMASVGIILNLIVAMVLWRERPHGKQYLGVATAVVIVVLANLPLHRSDVTPPDVDEPQAVAATNVDTTRD